MTAPLTTTAADWTADAAKPVRLLGVAGFVLCAVAFWMLQHPYEGLVHDSLLYAFTALARLHPDSLGHDLFLSQGTQDHYTIFGPLAAALIRMTGLEGAAALITAAAQLAFFACGWLVARRLMPSTLALVSAALLVTLPAIYGGEHLFSYTEGFMTARLASEALVLASLAAIFSRQYLPGALCLIGAVLLHPLMAAAGIALLFCLFVVIPRPRLALGTALGGLAVLVAIAWIHPMGPVERFDPEWFGLLHSRLPYLFPTLWSPEDWGHASVPFATLLVGARAIPPSPLRSILISALFTGLCGLGLALVGADLLHIVLLTQLQPWRWLWLSNALAVILIPVIAENGWRSGHTGRAYVVILAAAWIGIDERFAGILSLLAVGAQLATGRVTDERRGRLLELGAWTLLFVCVLVFVGSVLSVVRKLPSIPADRTLYTSDYLLLLRRLRPWASGGILTASTLGAVWWMAVRRTDRAGAAAATAAGILLCAAFLPLTWNAWTRTQFPRQTYEQFASWRQVIAPTAEVLWPDQVFATWYLLERPSYWSVKQMAGAVFSRATTMELVRREQILHQQPPMATPAQDLAEVCHRNAGLAFVITARDLGSTPFPQVVVDADHPEGTLRLYACEETRRGDHP